jgi:HAD superfamily hydrolase (TIGR01509 family)
MQPIGVIFDLDGVLIDSEGLQYAAYSRVLERFGVRVSEALYAMHWIAEGRGPEYAVETFRLPLAPDDLRALKGPVYHELLRRDVTLMPGVTDVLPRLAPHFSLAVATNSNRTDVGFVMEHFGLGPFFRAVVTREDYPQAKPAPDAYQTAAARLALPAAQCVVVEDAYRGVVAAHRAGAPVVAVPNRFTRGSDFSLAAVVLPDLDALSVDLVHSLTRRRA